MVFNNIHIRNLRGIRQADVSDLGRINIFFGKNNCGKSSLLEAIFLLTGPSNPMLPIKINSLRNYGRFTEYDLLLDFYNLRPDTEIEVYSEGEEGRGMKISTFFDEVGDVQLDAEEKDGSNTHDKFYGLYSSYWIGSKENAYHSKLSVQKGDLSKGKIVIDSRYKEDVRSLYVPSAYMQNPVAEAYGRIVENKKESQIIKILQSIEPKIGDMKLVGNELMVDIGLDQLLPLNMMGDGLRKLVAIVLAIYDCRDGVIAIDEVDNGFHYSAMISLWKALATASKESKTQIFITTHNIDFLKGLSPLLHQPGYEWLKDDVSAYKLIRNEEDMLTALRYDSETIEYSIDQEIEMR